MTLVTIDVSDVASETNPDDKVIFWAPKHRPGTHTARHAVPLEGGKASVELKPGPTMVKFQCRGISDTGEKQGTVPDGGTVTLDDVLDGAYEWSSPVVGEAQQVRDQAREYRDQARGYATTAQEGAARVGSVEQVGQWAEQAKKDAATAGRIAEELPSTIDTELDERVPPKVAKALADDQTMADAAAAAVDAAMPTKADTDYVDAQDQALSNRITDLHHYHGTGFPEGKVAAPVGSIYTDTLATAGAIRWIKTQGTGNTGWEVEYGDTGWRDIPTIAEGIDFLRIARTGNRVSIVGGGVRVATGGTYLTKVLPRGFTPAEKRITRGYMVIESAMYPVGNEDSQNRLNYQSPPYASSVTVGDQVAFEANWVTLDAWPVALPGTPG